MLALRLPSETAPVLPQLQAALPALYAYLVTFAVGASQWSSHYRLFEAAERIDEGVLNRNIAFLFLYSLLPFSTALVMTHGSEAIAVVIYALNLSLLSLTLTWVTGRLLGQGYLRADRRESVLHSRARLYAVSGVFALEALLALFTPGWALWTPLLVPLAFFVVDRWPPRRPHAA